MTKVFTLSLDGVPGRKAVRRIRDGLLDAFLNRVDVELGERGRRFVVAGVDRLRAKGKDTRLTLDNGVEEREAKPGDQWKTWQLTGHDTLTIDMDGARAVFRLKELSPRDRQH